MNLGDRFFQCIQQLSQQVRETNRQAIKELGESIAINLSSGGVLHTFGSGHSGILAQELVHRAGGLVPISAIVDPTAGWAETLPGYGSRLVDRHQTSFGLVEGETIIVISNSGRNPSPIEVAVRCSELGLNVAALTSLEMSRNSDSLHPGGKRLFEVADYVLDNFGVSGDAAITIPGSDEKIGPTSTFSGALILNLLSMEIVEALLRTGGSVPILRSANLPGAREHNVEISNRYRHRLSRPF